jgi:hypothetical protein
MKTPRRATRPERRDSRPTPSRPWQKPDFIEITACAEIGAYAFTG